MIAIILFIIFFIQPFADEDSKSFSNINKHLKYLVDKNIVEESHISFIEKNDLNKEDIIYYLQKIVKVIDRDKAKQEDLYIVENIIGDISEYISEFKKEMSSNSNKIEDFEKKIDELTNVVEGYKSEKEALIEKIDSLKKKIDDNIGEDFSNIKSFLAKWDVKWTGKGILSLYSDKNNTLSYFSDLTIHNDGITISALNNNFVKDSDIYSAEIDILSSNIYFHSTNFKKAFFSLTKSQSFTTYGDNNKFDKIGTGIYFYGTDIYISNKDKEYISIINFGSKYFDLFSNVKVEDLNNIKDSLSIDSFQAEIKIPIFSFAKIGIGGDVVYKNNKSDYFILLDFSYSKDNINIDIKGLGLLDAPKTKYVIPYISYTLEDIGQIGVFLNWNLTKSLENDQTFIEDWRLFLDYKIDKIDLSILAFSDIALDGSNELAKVLGMKTTLNLSLVTLKTSLLVRDRLASDIYGAAFFAEINVNIKSNFNVFATIMKSNFDYYDNKFRFDGSPYSFLFYNNLKIDQNSPVISIGFDLEM